MFQSPEPLARKQPNAPSRVVVIPRVGESAALDPAQPTAKLVVRIGVIDYGAREFLLELSYARQVIVFAPALLGPKNSVPMQKIGRHQIPVFRVARHATPTEICAIVAYRNNDPCDRLAVGVKGEQ